MNKQSGETAAEKAVWEINSFRQGSAGKAFGAKRQNNFEALRLIAMFMIIVLHYLDKGNLLTSTGEPFTASSYLAWLVESFAIVAVNVYVLITGYFMCESSMKVSRLLQIICQTMWYALLVPAVLVLLGVVSQGSFQLYDLLRFVFPVHMSHYWFVTAYVVLMLFVPFLNPAIRQMSRGQLLTVTILLTAYETLPKSVLPVKFTEDNAGNGVLWFICLYLIAAYIRKYGIPFFSSFRKSLVCYVGGALCIFASLLVMRFVYFKIDAFGESLSFGYHYNHILCLASSVALFYTVKHWELRDGAVSRLIGRIAPYTFGVYLLHEHILVRYEWMKWLKVQPTENVLLFVAELLWKCLLVLAAGLMADWLRAAVFKLVGKGLKHTPLPGLLDKLEHYLKG